MFFVKIKRGHVYKLLLCLNKADQSHLKNLVKTQDFLNIVKNNQQIITVYDVLGTIPRDT